MAELGLLVPVMQWKDKRRLVLVATPTWRGWFCERCGWQISLDGEPKESQHSEVQSQFDKHDCEEYARQTWTGPVD